MHTLRAIMQLPTTGTLPSGASDATKMFTIPAQVKDIFAPFTDENGSETMVIPFLKELTRANQISMKLGCAAVALTPQLLESFTKNPKDVKSTMETSDYVLERCKCWFAALEEM